MGDEGVKGSKVLDTSGGANGGGVGGDEMEMASLSSRSTPEGSSTTNGKSCLNKNLAPLKALLFFFYGALGIIYTWLNHTVFAGRRFGERDTALVYGISSLLSIATPVLFAIISDKSGQPKKVLIVCLFLAGLAYPWIAVVPASEPFHFKERLDWCRGLGRDANTCMPFKALCGSSHSVLVTNDVVCSEGCGGKIILSKCRYSCDEFLVSSRLSPGQPPTTTEDSPDYDDARRNLSIEASPLISSGFGDDDSKGVDLNFGPEPHVCLNTAKYQPICYVYDYEMHDIVFEVDGINGYNEAEDSGKCHYPLLKYSEMKKEFEQLLFCSPVSGPKCLVTCELRWNEPDQWVCRNNYNQWLISFCVFLVVHTLGTMLLISAAGLLNAAVLSMTHEHEHGDFYGCQLIYGTLGFAVLTPLFSLGHDFLQSQDWALSRNVDLFTACIVCLCLIIAAFTGLLLSYHAEWVPKPTTIRPMLVRWGARGTTLTFLNLVLMLGCFQGMIDVLGYYQIKSAGASLTTMALGATGAVVPALIFMFRVEKVIEFCGHFNILAIALVMFSLQFTGYAYLKNAEPEWSFLLKAMDTFSIFMVWITSAFVTHTSAPRSLVATSQAIVVSLYCCIGRGLGCLITYFGLSVFSKDYVLKAASLCSIIAAVVFIGIQYCCLKPLPYDRKKYELEKPASQGPSGKYIPLKLTEKKGVDDEKESDEM